MGETTCLMQPFSYTAGISHQPKERTPIHELGQSISFGRFASESLAWEKWSTFSHNKYVEEAEKFSRPGSVAQMKAFFEAHYRNLAARKAAEAANATAAAAEAKSYNDAPPSQPHEIVRGEGSQAQVYGQVGVLQTNPAVIIALDDNRDLAKSSVEMGEGEDMESSSREVDPLSENQAVVDDCVEVESLHHFVCVEDEEEVKELELSASKQMEQPLLKRGSISNRVEELGLVSGEDEVDVEELELSGSKQMEKPLLKQSAISNRDHEVGSVSKRKSAASTLKPLAIGRPTRVLSSQAKPSSSALKPLINSKTTKVLSPPTKPPAPASMSKSLIDSRTTKVLSSPAKPPASALKTLLNGRTTKILSSPVIPSASASKPLINVRTTKVWSSPAKPTSLLHSRKDSSATPIRSTLEFSDKRKSTPKSMHKSMNFTPVKEINRLTSSIIHKIDSSRVASTTKSSKGWSTPLRATTAVSMQLDPKQTLTPLTETARASTPLHPLASGSKTNRAKWSFLPTDCSNFLSSSKIRTQSPISTSPFSLRTEERAARRKKKLEEKFNADQAKIVQMQATLKEKAEAELKRLRRSLCFKARPLPDFYKERGSLRDHMEKSPRRTLPTTMQTPAQPLLKSSVKSSSSKNVLIKHDKLPRLQTTLHASRVLGENTSPNIQHY